MTPALHTNRRVVAESCPLCGAARWTVLTDADETGYEWVRCECAVVFKRSEPELPGSSDATLGDVETHYDPAYFARYARRRRRRIAKSRWQILDALEAAPQGRLLDVGCSLGYALEAARSLGLDAAGVDLSAHAVDACKRLGFEAQRGTLDALPFDDASFAMAVLKHVFEHTATPRRTLAELRRVLVPGGAMFLAVPHAGYFKAVRSPSTSRFFRGEAARAHFVYYSPRTLGRLVEQEGFRVVSIHPRLFHRRASLPLRLADAAMLPFRVPVRALADAFGLRKEFWMVAVRR
ncbi:MAG: class I SAM-dependent methyltransferase [Candidatus Binatia bacterium]